MVLNQDWLTNGNMTPDCILLDNQSETFLIQILIYKNRMLKRVIRENKKRDQKTTRDCQGTLNNLPAIKIQSPRLLEILGSRRPHLVTFLSQYSSSVCQESKHCCFIVSKKCFNKTIFVKFLATGFSVYYLSCWLSIRRANVTMMKRAQKMKLPLA